MCEKEALKTLKRISVCMIVKDEEDILEETLDSIKDIADELIIVDTGSTDGTKKIAQKFTDHVYDFEWIDDFSAARNVAYSYATKDYIFFMDADDFLPEDEREKMMQLKKDLDDSVDAVSMFTVVSVDEFGKPTFKFRRHRLVKRSNNFKWHGAVHEYLAVSGNIKHSDIAIFHIKQKRGKSVNTRRNLNIYEKRLREETLFRQGIIFIMLMNLGIMESFKERLSNIISF